MRPMIPNESDDSNAVNETIEADLTNASNKVVEADKACVAEEGEANEAIGAEKANETTSAIMANHRLLLDNGVLNVHYLSFSLTKYSAFLFEDKGYSGVLVDVHNNNLWEICSYTFFKIGPGGI
jgi:hypothetical protein